MLSLGVLSIIQAVFLPGFIIGFLVKDIRWVDRLLLALPLSLVVNYSEVLLLTLGGLYTRLIMIGTVIVELSILILLLTRQSKQISTQKAAAALLQGMSQDFTLTAVDIFIIALVACFTLPFLYVAWRQVGTVFDLWDVVVSWNRWAVTWYHGELPHGTWQYPDISQTYPQGIPILYSLTYQFIGDERVQFFAKIIAIAFPLFAFATLFRAAFIFKELRNTLLLGVAIFIWVLSHGYAGMFFVFGGYVDVPMAYFGVFAIYIFALLAQRARQIGASVWVDPLTYLAVVAISAAALVKQTGVLLAIFFPLALYFYIDQGKRGAWKERKVWWGCLTFTLLLILHWYVYKAIQIFRGSDNSLVSVYSSLIPGDWLMRPVNGLQMFFGAIGWAWLPAFIAGLFIPFSRRLALWGVLPIFLFWAFFVSYDLRALFITFSWISLILAVGCFKLFGLMYSRPRLAPFIVIWLGLLSITIINKSPVMVTSMINFAMVYDQISIQFILICLFSVLAIFSGIYGATLIRVRNVLISAILILCIVITVYYTFSRGKTEQLINNSIAKQQEIGYPKLNKSLLEYFPQHVGNNEYVATSYQLMGFIPGLQEHFKLAQCEDLSFLSMDAVKFYLYMTSCPISVRERFEKIMGDKAQKIKEGQGYVLYKISHS